jgi:hypothetical protein
VTKRKYIHILIYPVLTVQNCAFCQSGKQEIHVGIFLGLIFNASGFISDTSYTKKKLGHTAEKKNRRSVYIIGLRGCEQSEDEKPS